MTDIQIKVLVNIELAGRTLVREEIPTKIEWILTVGDVSSRKHLATMPEDTKKRIVRKGKSIHYNLVAKPAYRAINVNQYAYNYMTSSESYEPWMREKWTKKQFSDLSSEERLKIHLGRLCEHYNGKGYTYVIIN